MVITHKLTLDLQNRTMPSIVVKQGDCLSRCMELSLMSNGDVWNVPGNAQLRLAYTKPDKVGGCYDRLPDERKALTAKGNVVTAMLHPQMFTTAGVVRCELQMESEAGEKLSTFCWYMVVDPSAVNALASEEVFDAAEKSLQINGIRAENGQITLCAEHIMAQLGQTECSVQAALDVLSRLTDSYILNLVDGHFELAEGVEF